MTHSMNSIFYNGVVFEAMLNWSEAMLIQPPGFQKVAGKQSYNIQDMLCVWQNNM